MLALSKEQRTLCEDAARVEECFADCGTADQHLIDGLVTSGHLRKTKSRKTPYEFTMAGCIAVALWNSIESAKAALE